MSGFIVTRLSDQIIILSDTATFVGYHDFTITGFMTKTLIFPRIEAAMVARGTVKLASLLHLNHGTDWVSFDDMVQMLPLHADEEIERYREHFPSRPAAAEIVVGGWSTARARFETHGLHMSTDSHTFYEMVPLPAIYMAPEASRERMEANGLVGDTGQVSIMDLARDLPALMQAQRETPQLMGYLGDDADEAEERYCIGGCIERVTIMRGSIVCDVVKRWPEDEVGEMIALS